MASSAPPTVDRERGNISRDDIEDKFRELFEGARGEAASAKNTIVSVGIVIGVILLLVAFLLGRRGGKKRSTIVEIRRV
jgi:hypothetical protein